MGYGRSRSIYSNLKLIFQKKKFFHTDSINFLFPENYSKNIVCSTFLL